MKRVWLAIAGLLVLPSAIWIALRHGDLPKDDSESQRRSAEPSRRPTRDLAERGKLSRPRDAVERMDDEELKSNAILLLLELNESKDYTRILLQSQLSSLFREWGNRDIAAVERFLQSENAAQGSFDGQRHYREDLILAAWIGYSRVNPIGAWASFSKAWAEEERELILRTQSPLSHESAGYHLFKAYYNSDPASALGWIRKRNVGLGALAGPAIQVVMSATQDSNDRQQLFMELCVDDRASDVDIALVCAGVAEQDPEQAWKFIYWGRENSDGPMTSDSPEIIASEMILHWSIRQPEQALEFVLSPERKKLRMLLLPNFIMTQMPRRPELMIHALEHKELADVREKFQFATMTPMLLHNRISWPLVDESMPLPPNERVRIMTEAVNGASLPPSLKNNILKNLSLNP